jgi:hypothetical protein
MRVWNKILQFSNGSLENYNFLCLNLIQVGAKIKETKLQHPIAEIDDIKIHQLGGEFALPFSLS